MRTSKFKEDILRLKAEGKTNSEIRKELKCSKSTIDYYCNEKFAYRIRTNRSITNRHPYMARMERFRYRGNIKPSQKYTLEDVIEKFGENPVCYLSGRQINIYDAKSYHFDHIVPVARGGDNSLANMGICITDINKAKWILTDKEYINLAQEVTDYQNSKKIKVIVFTK